jgi:hypothetical protein
MDLEYEKVCLAGNHENHYLQYRLADPEDTKKQLSFLKSWLRDGVEETLASVLNGPENEALLGNFMNFFKKLSDDDPPKEPVPSLILPEKYDRFLLGLNYSHREVFKIKDREVGFCFFHSLPAWDQSLEDQLKIRTGQDFLNYLNTVIPHFRYCMSYKSEFDYIKCQSAFQITKINPEYTFLNLCTYALRWGYGPDVIVHGHIPPDLFDLTDHKERNNPDFKFLIDSYNYYLAWPFLWTRAHRGGYKKPKNLRNPLSTDPAFREIEFMSPRGGAVEAVNINTCAAIDGALTAIGLSDETLSLGLIPVISAFDEKNANYPGLCCERLIRVQNLGHQKDDRRSLVKMMNDFTDLIDEFRKLNNKYIIYNFKLSDIRRVNSWW